MHECDVMTGGCDAAVKLVILESPYRSLTGPLLSYIDIVQKKCPKAMITVLVPEYVPHHWWEQLLHSQTALRLKAALLFRPNTVVTSVPYHSKDWRATGRTDTWTEIGSVSKRPGGGGL